MSFDLIEHTHLLTIAGSRAYNLNSSTSDIDLKGVGIPPIEYYVGIQNNWEQTQDPNQIALFLSYLPEDLQAIAKETKLEGTVFQLNKFVKLASDCNPNILDVLFCEDHHVLYASWIGKHLRANRNLFLSLKGFYTFTGYAFAQLKRIKGHRAWLLNPPKSEPTRKDFNLPESHALIPHDHYMAVEAAIKKQIDQWQIDFGNLADSERIHVESEISNYLTNFTIAMDPAYTQWLAAARTIGLTENLIESMQLERAYNNARNHWKQYTNWKTSRNPDRAALEEKFGYDTKHAMHLIRLLTMGKEILMGKCQVARTYDREFLLDIRQGKYSYDEIIEFSDKLNEEVNLIKNDKTYTVPVKPDYVRIDQMVQKLILTDLDDNGSFNELYA